MLTEKPQFSPHFRVEAISPDLVFLLHEHGHRVLRGRPYCLLAPHLDGRSTADQIVERLSGQIKPAEVYYCLQRLAKEGLLLNDLGGCPLEEAAFWSSQSVDPRPVRGILERARVRLQIVGQCDPGPLSTALASLGISLCQEQESLLVVLVDDYLRPELSDLNAAALAQGRPWLLGKPSGSVAWLGPLFEPGTSVCWECLATRLRRNREVERFVAERQGLPVVETSRPSLPTTLAQAANLCAGEVARYLVEGQNNRMRDRVQTLDFGSLQTQSHALRKNPHCAACGQPALLDMEPLVLHQRLIVASEDAGYRVCSPEQAWESLKDHVSPITGVVQQLTRTDHSDGVAPVYLAGHNQAQLNPGYHALRAGLRSQSSGKGKTDLQARVSGLCEAIERYSGVFRGDERRRRATFGELGSAAIDPSDCLLFSRDQYQRRQELNATLSDMHFIPRPFNPTESIEWTPLWSLTAGAVRYLPTSFCFYNYQDPEAQNCPTCLADSNGNAAGSTLEEAILQGFLELAERDAVAVWWYNRLAVPGVDLESLEDPYISRLRDYYSSLQRRFWVLDVTGDLGIPTYAAVSAAQVERPAEILLGFGAHLDARIAILRAIEEMNQSLPHLLKWKRGETEMEALTAKFWRRATLAKQSYLCPTGTPRVVSQRSTNPDLKEAVESCRRLVEERGMEFLVLDQTRADIGLPVVKVVVPGMRHFWPRFAPGRLYDVPVATGQLAEATKEAGLNPIPMIL